MRLQELPPSEVCPNSSIPPPGPPRSYGGEKDSKDGGAEGWWWGQLQAWSGPACTLRVPGVRKRTIADPQSPEPSESPARAFLPSSSKFSAEAGRVQNRGPGGARRRADRAGGTGSRLGVPRTPRREWRGLVIHSHPRSLRTYPYPSRPASGGESAGESPSPDLARPSSLLGPPPFPSSSVSPPVLCRHLAAGGEKGLVAGPSQPLRPARPPRLLPSSEPQTQRRGPELRTPRREASQLPAPRTHPI